MITIHILFSLTIFGHSCTELSDKTTCCSNIGCIIVLIHRDDGHRSDRNMLLNNNNTWLNIFINVHVLVYHKTKKKKTFIVIHFLCTLNLHKLQLFLYHMAIYRIRHTLLSLAMIFKPSDPLRHALLFPKLFHIFQPVPYFHFPGEGWYSCGEGNGLSLALRTLSDKGGWWRGKETYFN